MSRQSGMKPAARLFAEAPLARGAEVALTDGQAHYLRTVLRLEPGRQVLLFNGRDGEWLADIAALRKSGGVATARSQRRAQAPEPDLWLLFAPIKGDRVDWVAEKATELGAARLQPVMTRHTVVTRINTDRLRSRAIESRAADAICSIFGPIEESSRFIDRNPARLCAGCQGYYDGRRAAVFIRSPKCRGV